MAGAASFTHMHDWTMANVPAGTGDWFGWANAMASELTPTVAVLDVRRRRRNGTSVRFPTAVLVASVGLSLAAQFARATPSVSGWLLAAVPAVAFIVLTKMVLAGPSRTTEPEPLQDNESDPTPATVDADASTLPTDAPSAPESPTVVTVHDPAPTLTPAPASARPLVARVVAPSRPVARVNGSAREVPSV
ncbi:DUF2637 domain-containing protein [Actinocatenispora sera]|uniref:DUF2637 domain-containing protein n=2 Tax=Actinocatenispora sera TaxID=390989 RepID=A0A810KX08_9ACTN|nr:DUF2637 domain-containing protein [Actinocatenispora sera]BCJ26876.1 hypothetical protein Asera_09840 [Actinocatenispora sera]